ncbi:MAG TPA: LacI family DNA-binding transcriptional regulator [Fimbriimonadaceae bacterium]|nr:LacI family DNA-binding transcriptional regulator [Fimbriimonadaceae bacterium]
MAQESGSRKPVRLTDVAREAGVSVQTASHVMAGNMTVRLPESTRLRVFAAAEKVGYRPNRLAQAMKRGKTQLVSVWMPLDRPTPSYMRQLHSINTLVRADGYELMITGLDAPMAYSAVGKTPYVWPVDGLIAIDAGKAVSAFRADQRNDSIPVVVLGLEEFVNSDSVAWDVAGASKQATEKLLEMGCRNIVHVTLDWILRDYPREQRRRGYTEAMTEAGLEPSFVSVGNESSDAAETAVAAYLESNPQPDAFSAFTDSLAIGASRAILARGRSIPGDCRIVGYGDYSEARDFRVPISTLRIPIDAVMSQAWTWLKERMTNPDLPGRLAVLPMEWIERESTGP